MIISVCESLYFVMDGYCDDGNNLEECAWDGGDCCGGKQYRCEVCYCHLDDLEFAADFGNSVTNFTYLVAKFDLLKSIISKTN